MDKSRAQQRIALPLVARVFYELSDGQIHSGEELAKRLSVSRNAVWKAAQALRGAGTRLHAVRHRGYQLPATVEPLSAESIRRQLATGVLQRIYRLEVLWTTESTNSDLFVRAHPQPGHTEVLLAEYQTAGRGRQGRKWFAPPGGAIPLSLSWTFADLLPDVGPLGIAVAVCLLRTLRNQGLKNVLLKWPNDILIGEAKLGGILIESRGESGAPRCVVIGIGLNASLGAGLQTEISRSGVEPVDLASVTRSPFSRNAIAASLIEHCINGLLEFERRGLASFIDEWSEADALRGREVSAQSRGRVVSGFARGIDKEGRLIVETREGCAEVSVGDVHVRALPS